MHRWWRWLVLAVIVAGGATLGWKRYALARSKAQPPRAPPALVVTTVAASRGHRREPLRARHRHADRHRHGDDPRRRPAHVGELPRRADGACGRRAGRDRPAPVPGAAPP